MAQDMTEKELLKMELDQLKKEVKNERQMVSISPKMEMDFPWGNVLTRLCCEGKTNHNSLKLNLIYRHKHVSSNLLPRDKHPLGV